MKNKMTKTDQNKNKEMARHESNDRRKELKEETH